MSLKPHVIERMQLTSVAHAIAYRTARAAIETRLPPDDMPSRHMWYDTTGYGSGKYVEEIALALRYLQLCGLLETHPQHEHLVRPLDPRLARRHCSSGSCWSPG